jgi:hypothetical protein
MWEKGWERGFESGRESQSEFFGLFHTLAWSSSTRDAIAAGRDIAHDVGDTLPRPRKRDASYEEEHAYRKRLVEWTDEMNRTLVEGPYEDDEEQDEE